ncbi:protein transport protein sec61 beta subunit [Klebsormidium nitens]|uniref:Protein transport protein sec61 beta subunit n=1 Tax=Klebsormidium nitens TaxID=105231 RepID=A0A1Y1IIN4_KLENI|nr:protein transport protein sec61 beta subunit [Klebsormidium nitens]|eukprot:GAQ90664.1 protein transport protein sec61 beta subunit [Klebsormidium nitens]
MPPKGSSSQASSLVRRGSGAATAAPPAGTLASRPSGGAKGPRRRSGYGGAVSSSLMRFYTDDAPGLKISPTVVLVMSVAFIGFVTLLHVFGKLYAYRKGA